MSFITKEDFGTTIRERYLDAITEFDDDILESATNTAIEEIKSYLTNRYDIDEIFNKTGNDRSLIVLMYVKDMTIYHLHSLINPRKIPEHRITRYEQALDWLNKVNNGIINPDLPLMQGGEKNYILYGSNPKRNNHL
jgi:phage gp36-like protein